MGTPRTTSAPAPPPPAAPGNTGLSLPPIGLPPAKSAMPWWEQRQSPWWENQPPPTWERQQVPLYLTNNPSRALLDRGLNNQQRQQVPLYLTNNPSRALLDRSRNNQQAFIGNNRGRWHNRKADVVYVIPSYGYFPTMVTGVNEHYIAEPPPTTTPVPAGSVEPAAVPVGALRLEVEPRDLLQVFVDGVFVGTPSADGNEIELAPGIRHVELRASGYKPLTFDAEILPDRLITYRGKLDRDEAANPSTPAPTVITPSAAPAPTTMYVIPGCYLGNVEPKEADLKPGCNIRSMITILR